MQVIIFFLNTQLQTSKYIHNSKKTKQQMSNQQNTLFIHIASLCCLIFYFVGKFVPGSIIVYEVPLQRSGHCLCFWCRSTPSGEGSNPDRSRSWSDAYCPSKYFYAIFNNKNQNIGFVSSLPYIYLKSFALFASKRSDYYKITGMYQTHIFSC